MCPSTVFAPDFSPKKTFAKHGVRAGLVAEEDVRSFRSSSRSSAPLTSPWHDAMERAGPGLRSALLDLASWAQTPEQVTRVQHLVASIVFRSFLSSDTIV